MRRKRLLLGFDRILHAYSRGWHGGDIYDDPVPGALQACERLQRRYDVVVFTARADSPERTDAVRQWLANRGFPELPVTNIKVPAHLIVDQRAYRFSAPWWTTGVENDIDFHMGE
jgi:hypothetical protein